MGTTHPTSTNASVPIILHRAGDIPHKFPKDEYLGCVIFTILNIQGMKRKQDEQEKETRNKNTNRITRLHSYPVLNRARVFDEHLKRNDYHCWTMMNDSGIDIEEFPFAVAHRLESS